MEFRELAVDVGNGAGGLVSQILRDGAAQKLRAGLDSLIGRWTLNWFGVSTHTNARLGDHSRPCFAGAIFTESKVVHYCSRTTIVKVVFRLDFGPPPPSRPKIRRLGIRFRAEVAQDDQRLGFASVFEGHAPSRAVLGDEVFVLGEFVEADELRAVRGLAVDPAGALDADESVGAVVLDRSPSRPARR